MRRSISKGTATSRSGGRAAFQLLNERTRAHRRQSTAPSLFITENAEGNVLLPNLTHYRVRSVEEVMYLVLRGNLKRTVAETASNLFSSRSHAILQLTVTQRTGEKALTSKVSMIDLAGSERATNYRASQQAQRQFEGQNINRSLLALANCINLLATRQGGKPVHVPYRDSKLTRLLKDSLGGSTPTLMVTCISLNPLQREETLNTLNYAARARQIKKLLRANQARDATKEERASQVRELQGEVEELKEKLQERNQIITRMQHELREKKIREEEEAGLSDTEQESPSRLMKSIPSRCPRVGMSQESSVVLTLPALEDATVSESCITAHPQPQLKSVRSMNETELIDGNI